MLLPSYIHLYVHSRGLESLLAIIVADNGLSEKNIPLDSNYKRLKDIIRRYGAVTVEAEKIRDLIDQLTNVIKRFQASHCSFAEFHKLIKSSNLIRYPSSCTPG
jgi:hypothetical protein